MWPMYACFIIQSVFSLKPNYKHRISCLNPILIIKLHISPLENTTNTMNPMNRLDVHLFVMARDQNASSAACAPALHIQYSVVGGCEGVYCANIVYYIVILY